MRSVMPFRKMGGGTAWRRNEKHQKILTASIIFVYLDVYTLSYVSLPYCYQRARDSVNNPLLVQMYPQQQSKNEKTLKPITQRSGG